MLDPKLLSFSDDSPKENPWQDDRLGFQPFARRVSEMVLNLEAPNGYVIGLHGPWGSGKSTALNFIQAFIQKHNEELEDRSAELSIINFRPWMVSGHQDLVAAFFNVLSETLDKREGKALKRGRGALRTVRAGLDPIIDTVAKIGMAADHTGGAATAAVLGAATVGKKSLGGAIDRWLEEPSIQSAYDKLTDQLAAKGRRFLILVDDMDRLDDDEIKSIMQMVKTVGRLPNVIYLLAYDQRIVTSALDKDRTAAGDYSSFAEKIIQQEFELPRAGKNALLRTLEGETRFLLDAIEPGSHSRQILASGLHRWMRYPRDVTRLANALKFVWPTIQGEIDAVDVLAMEGLRLFDPRVFEWIQRNHDFLFGAGRYLLPHDEAKDGARKALTALFLEENRSEQLDLLCALFPSRAKDLRGEKRGYSEENYGSLVRRRGIGHQPGYDTYFNMYPTDDAVSKVKIDDAMSHLEDQALQAAYLAEFMGRKTSTGEPLITEYLDEIYHRLRGTNAPVPTSQLLKALFKVGDAMAAFGWTGVSSASRHRRT